LVSVLIWRFTHVPNYVIILLLFSLVQFSSFHLSIIRLDIQVIERFVSIYCICSCSKKNVDENYFVCTYIKFWCASEGEKLSYRANQLPRTFDLRILWAFTSSIRFDLKENLLHRCKLSCCCRYIQSNRHITWQYDTIV
jgi:hypothetical protein